MSVTTSALDLQPEVPWPYVADGMEEGEEPMGRKMSQAVEYLCQGIESLSIGPFLLETYEPILYRSKGAVRRVVPDVWLALGSFEPPPCPWVTAERGDRGPDLVVEFASPSTVRRDLTVKRHVYAAIGVREYFLFDPFFELDPDRESLPVALMGYRLAPNGRFQPIDTRDGRLPSEVLGVELAAIPPLLRLWQANTQQLVPTDAERAALLQRQLDELVGQKR